ncbi:hypothetical protein PHJA_002058300 [Phtheirospermum japonicum]|uniref:Uncharacterized protein n=1 Tax=Phtheirospermum japonicum TaxID=374723 RepID=A0A830CSP2_9LAMI|nr:hypothetical protein PHJA_002058300 [Phtheirospermum japonicum]
MMQVSGVLPDVSLVSTSAGGCRSQELKQFSSFFDAKFFLAPGLPKNCLFPNPKIEVGSEKLRTRGFIVRASGNSGGNLIPVAPLQLESPVGQLLAQIQQTHPHLLMASAEQQLENLQSQKDGKKETNAPSAQDLLLYKRIAEVKEKERRKTLEDIIYCLLVQRFVDNHISMIPKITATSDPSGRVDFWPNQEQKLESVHSPEAFEMILSHLSLVLGERVVGPLDTIIQISKIKLGKLYAASIMYGYFLRRVDERYQLERSMNTLPEGFGEERVITFDEPTPEKQLWDPDSLIRIYPDDVDGGGIVDSGNEEKSYKLRSYVMYLDAETLQRYATIRSKEAVSLIEKQTQALFGRPDITVTEDGSLDASNDEVVSLTFSGLTMLVLEAVAFGSFLWDTENFVESKYPFINS